MNGALFSKLRCKQKRR